MTAAMHALAVVVAAANDTVTLPPEIVQLVQVGVAGVVIIGFLRGWIWPKPPVDRLQADYDRLVKQYDDLVATYQKEVIPTLSRAADALTRRTGAR